MDESPSSHPDDLDSRLARHLAALRKANGWSLDDLATRSGVSRATLSRLEKAEVSATANVLGRLASAHGLPVSRLLMMAEGMPEPFVPRAGQPLWSDPDTRFRRRAVSPPAEGFSGEVLEGEIPEGTRLAYHAPAKPGHEHHLVMLEGRLAVTVEGRVHHLHAGDCLRFRLYGGNAFETPADSGARYLLFLI